MVNPPDTGCQTIETFARRVSFKYALTKLTGYPEVELVPTIRDELPAPSLWVSS